MSNQKTGKKQHQIPFGTRITRIISDSKQEEDTNDLEIMAQSTANERREKSTYHKDVEMAETTVLPLSLWELLPVQKRAGFR